jgi:hypothetical protein
MAACSQDVLRGSARDGKLQTAPVGFTWLRFEKSVNVGSRFLAHVRETYMAAQVEKRSGNKRNVFSHTRTWTRGHSRMTLAQQHYGCGTTVVETRQGIFHWNVGGDEPKRSKVATRPADFSIGMAHSILVIALR